MPSQARAQRAKSTFCWLPPERFTTSVSSPGTEMLNLWMSSKQALFSSLRLMKPKLDKNRPKVDMVMLEATLWFSTSPSVLRFSVRNEIPRPMLFLGEAAE